MRLPVFRFGFFKDGDVGVGVFPEAEEIFVRSEHPDAGGIGIRTLQSSRLQSIGTSQPRCAKAPVQQFQTMPLWSMIF